MRKHTIDSLKKVIVERSEEDGNGCWIWQGASDGRYGTVYVTMLSQWPLKVHRASWAAYHNHGELPASGLEVMHKCDVTMCVNPAHLTVGTHADNMFDKRIKNSIKKMRAEWARLEAEDERAVELCRAANAAEVL